MERKLCNKASDCESENKKGHLGKINKQESFKGVRKKIKQNKTKTDKKKIYEKKQTNKSSRRNWRKHYKN